MRTRPLHAIRKRTVRQPPAAGQALAGVQEATCAHTPEALATLARIRSHTTAAPAAQVAAATALLDRLPGRPTQSIEATATPLPEPPFDFDTLPEHLREALEEILLLADTAALER